MTAASSPADSGMREEWEVTGDPGGRFPAYRWVFGNPRFNNEGESVQKLGATAEQQAREFIRVAASNWPSYKLRHRTVTETPWEDAAP